MKKKKSNSIEDKQEQLIQNALRAGGFVFPQTVSEVEAFERNFGITDVTLPEHLKVPDFIAKGKSKKKLQAGFIAMQEENFAMAAREGAPKLSEEVRVKMQEDRKKADARFKKNNTKRK